MRPGRASRVERSPRLARVGLALAVLLLSWGFLEIAGRSLPEERVPPGYRLDHRLGWALPAGETMIWRGHRISINSLGLRGPEPPARPARRVLVLGDSTIFGHDVPSDATLPVLLQGRLGAAGEIAVQNGGVPGYTCRQSLALLRTVRDRFPPDLVLVYNLHSDARRAHERDLIWLGSGTGTLAHTGVGRLATHAALWLRSRVGGPATSLADYRSCLEALVRDQRCAGGDTLLVRPVSRGNLRGDPGPCVPNRGEPCNFELTMAEVAVAAGVPLVDLPAELEVACPGCMEALMMDEVHPTAGGLALMAMVLDPRLRASLAREPPAGGGPP
jgi:lysophospholipase L1-like esterase